MTDENAVNDRMYHHFDEAEATGSDGDPELLEAVTAHAERHFGPVEDVFHQLISAWVHVDILVIPPCDGHPCWRLVTCGMAERAMPGTPDGDPELSHTELMMVFPPSWPMKDPKAAWALQLLQDLAELPHRFETWLHQGHTVPSGPPPAKEYARGVGFTGVMLVPPCLVPDDFGPLTVGDREIHFLAVMPLYTEEMDIRLEHGSDALFERLIDAGVTEAVELGRESVGEKKPRRSRFGLRVRR